MLFCYRGTPVVKLRNMMDVIEDVGLVKSDRRVNSQNTKDPCNKTKGKTEK